MSSFRSNIQSFKYQRFKPSGFKEVGFRNFEFVSKTQILSVTMKVKTCLKMKCRHLYKIFRLTLTEEKCKKK